MRGDSHATSSHKLLTDGSPLKVYSPGVYFEARSTDGKIEWFGTHTINFGTRTLRAHEWVFDPGANTV
jgi:hypothetical protein